MVLKTLESKATREAKKSESASLNVMIDVFECWPQLGQK
jgi:hypothetical protein